MARNNANDFAAALLQGYTTGLQIQQQRERHELEMDRARDERDLRKELQAIDKPTKAMETYVVNSPDGDLAFTDAKTAQEAARAIGDSASITTRFNVGDQTFNSREAADVALEAANAPAVKLRRRAEVALKYGRPDLADAYTKNYNNMLEANRRDLQESFLQAQATGDVSQVLDAYNKRLPNGATAELIPTNDGSLSLQIMRDGEPVSQRSFKSSDEFWTAMGQTVAQTPDNMLETWRTREQLAQGAKGLDIQDRTSRANIRQGDERIALEGRKVSSDIKNDAIRTGIAQGQLGLARRELGLKEDMANRPSVISGVNPTNGNVVVGATETYRDPTTKQWGLRTLPTIEQPNMAPTRTAAPDTLGGLLRGGVGGPLPAIDWSKLPAKNPGQGGTVVTNPTAPPMGIRTPSTMQSGYTPEQWQHREEMINQIPR